MIVRGGVIVAVLLLSATPVRSAAQGSGVSRAGILLTLPTDTRSLGLAHASSATARDEWATFHSPAQLATVRRASAGLATEGYLAGTQLSAASVALPVGRGTMGIAATLLDYGTIPEIVSTSPGGEGIETGRTHSAQDYALVVAYGFDLSGAPGRSLRIGLAAEYVSTRIADLSGSGAALSAGVAGSLRGGWDFAAAVQHLGSDVAVGATRGSLPTTARISVAAPARQVGQVSIRPMIEGRTVRGSGSAAALAAEATWIASRGTTLAFRSGYTVRTGAAEDRWPVSVGMGVALGAFVLDYAIERFPTDRKSVV